MKGMGKIWWVLVLAGLLALPVASWGEVYVEGYLGGMAAANAPLHPVTATDKKVSSSVTPTSVPNKFEPTELGGLKIGTWFDNEGFRRNAGSQSPSASGDRRRQQGSQ
jgi:hypothetical protein